HGNPLAGDARRGRQVVLPTPLLSDASLQTLLSLPRFADHVLELDLCADHGETLEVALDDLCRHAVDAVRDGAKLIRLSDRRPRPGMVPVHALAATGAVHARLIAEGLRCRCH